MPPAAGKKVVAVSIWESALIEDQEHEVVRCDSPFLLRTQTKARSENPLCSRQREVLQLLAEGKSAKEIGPLLFIQAGTVIFHKYKIMDTLGIRTNAELIEYAIR